MFGLFDICSNLIYLRSIYPGTNVRPLNSNFHIIFSHSQGQCNHPRFQRTPAYNEISFVYRGLVIDRLSIRGEKKDAMLLVAGGCKLLLEPRTLISLSPLKGLDGSAPLLSHLPFNNRTKSVLKPMYACHIPLTSTYAQMEHIEVLPASNFV